MAWLSTPSGARALEGVALFGSAFAALSLLVVLARRESWLLPLLVLTGGAAAARVWWSPGRSLLLRLPPPAGSAPLEATQTASLGPTSPAASPALETAAPRSPWIEVHATTKAEAQRILAARAFEGWLGVGGDGSAFGRLPREMSERVEARALAALAPGPATRSSQGEVWLRARDNPQAVEAALVPLGLRPTAASVTFEVGRDRSKLPPEEVARRLSVLFPLQSGYYLGSGFFASPKLLAQELGRARFDLGNRLCRVRVKDWREEPDPSGGTVVRFRVDVE